MNSARRPSAARPGGFAKNGNGNRPKRLVAVGASENALRFRRSLGLPVRDAAYVPLFWASCPPILCAPGMRGFIPLPDGIDLRVVLDRDKMSIIFQAGARRIHGRP